jgi:SAM-dependent methyltransferase
MEREGWEGWDEYAPFYDWENARTLGRRDVPFWRRLTRDVRGCVLELGCGTGRVSLPLARAGVRVVGLDRSTPMLDRARLRACGAALKRTMGRSVRSKRGRLDLVRGDIRALPFGSGRFAAVLAPYGILQSLLSDRDLSSALQSAARVLRPGGTLGIDLVPDVPNWREYRNRVQLRGRSQNGVHLTLIETVRQDRARRRTTFEQQYVERRGRHVRKHSFDLSFRTLSVAEMRRRLERAGFAVRAVLGDYQGRPWDARADVWIILAEKV